MSVPESDLAGSPGPENCLTIRVLSLDHYASFVDGGKQRPALNAGAKRALAACTALAAAAGRPIPYAL